MPSRYLTVVMAAAAAALVSFASGASLSIGLYDLADYSGTSSNVPFSEVTCTRLPTLPTQSIRIPADYHCSFYVDSDCSGDSTEFSTSQPRLSPFANTAFTSFKCFKIV
ncbi:MAG: hypothetical protein J3R72DRAFT_492390 [Linnemannia gamsii]|nr:MAG: hypothetical protein J3R72DRAFT_492390 [Linnemannia gamsii]